MSLFIGRAANVADGIKTTVLPTFVPEEKHLCNFFPEKKSESEEKALAFVALTCT